MGHVYLIVNTLGHHKIGITAGTIEKRLKQLKTGNSEHLNLIESYQTEHYRHLEKMLHRYFAVKHIDGEWFLLDKEDIRLFKDICAKLESNIAILKEQNPFFH